MKSRNSHETNIKTPWHQSPQFVSAEKASKALGISLPDLLDSPPSFREGKRRQVSDLDQLHVVDAVSQAPELYLPCLHTLGESFSTLNTQYSGTDKLNLIENVLCPRHLNNYPHLPEEEMALRDGQTCPKSHSESV